MGNMVKPPPYGISIHAPREGGDAVQPQLERLQPDFNPRPPRGGGDKAGPGHHR